MNVKEFCQRFGISPNDSAWILHKHKKHEGDAKSWFDLVADNLLVVPTTLVEAIKPIEILEEAVKPSKTKKSDKEEIA